MDELISRQVAIDALKETDDVGVCWKGGYVQRHSDFEEAINCIKELPSAQPEIIRCKDCKFYSTNNYLPNNGGGCTRSGGLEYLITSDEYCSKGEQK